MTTKIEHTESKSDLIKENEKQAVLLIHGIGEQRPMSTLRSFVDAVWTNHKAIHDKENGNGMRSKPDKVSRSFAPPPHDRAKQRQNTNRFLRVLLGTLDGRRIILARALMGALLDP